MKPHILFLTLCAALTGCATLEGLTTPAPAARGSVEQTGSTTAKPSVLPSPSTAATPTPSAPPGFLAERVQQALATGRWDVAEGYYLQLIRLKPNDATVWFQLGNLYAEQGRLDSAERAYRESLRRRDDARTLHNLGLVQVRLGVGALREAQARLPPDDSTRQETREFLQTLLETAAPDDGKPAQTLAR